VSAPDAGPDRRVADLRSRERDAAKRCTVGFALMSEHSSYNAAFGLARVLRERGHRPVFFTSDRTVFAGLVREHGFGAAAIPPGHESHRAGPPRTARWRLWQRLRQRAESIRREQDYLVDLIGTNALDLCLLDTVRYDLYPLALALARAGVPSILLSYTFASRLGSGHPPVFSSLVPTAPTFPGALSRARHALLWLWALGARGHGRAFGRAEYLQLVARKWLAQARNVSFERALRRSGRRSTWSEWQRRPRIAEIVFGHRALDWPAIADDPERCYFGTTDLFRTSAEFAWPALDPGKPVVYCNLSTINGFENIVAPGAAREGARADLSARRFRMARRYLDAVLGAFSQRQDWQLLVACGPFYPALKAAGHAANIHLFERLPQLAVLARADLAITWGGAGTVRECVNHGVPMVVLPAWTDQFGNAARVAARHLGVRGDMFDVTPGMVVDMVERALTDPAIRASVAQVLAQSDPAEEIRRLAAFVERHTGLRL
jgi:UDP:flavonoid glycosyltransferase YjiC (YdhE family)